MDTKLVRALVEDYYDIQGTRIQAENRVRAYLQGTSDQTLPLLKSDSAKRLRGIEKDIVKDVKDFLKHHELWCNWLEGVKGIGPVLAGGLLAWFEDVENFATISKLWMYSGLGVSEEGRAMKRTRGEKIRYNPQVKVLCWKIGESFVKTKGGYRELYEKFRDEYDRKWTSSEVCGSVGCKNKGKGKCMDGHKFAAAKRKTVKVFLAHLHMKWRELKGLPIEHPFIIGRDNHEHLIEIIHE